ncbi:unnamed protein product [Caenorhabditis angaria]|uniref:UPAR/Ly6 domain-containing protein n=1 Tax=Caenorhabditis angaria TaxID=860376 RepID=A0A9P1J1R9_9PELO|nr:unnamed protein product [Caenorhabditis angaria]
MQFSILFLILPILGVTSFTCVQEQDSADTPYSAYGECSSNMYCYTMTETYQNNVVKVRKDCDNGSYCGKSGSYSNPPKSSGSVESYYCCQGDYCNSAKTFSTILMLPIVFVSYMFFK